MLVTNESNDTTTGAPIGPFAWTFAASFFGYLSVFVLVHLPGYLRDRGASEATIGASIAVASLAGILARPFVGRLMDARGRRPALALGGSLLVAGAALHLAIPGPGLALFAIRALHGIGGGMFFSAVFAVASDLAPPRARTKRLALFGISGILPMSLGALLGDLVLARFGHKEVFVVAAALAALAFGCGISVRETKPDDEGGAARGMLAPLRDPALTGLWISGILFATSVASYFAFVRNYLAIESLATVSFFFTPYAVMAIVVRLLFSSVPGRIGEAKAVAGALFVLALGLTAIASAHGPAGVIFAGLLCGLGHAFVYPALMTLFVERSDPATRGSVVAMFTALMDIGILLSGYGFGSIADAYGHRVVFAASAGIALAALVTFLVTAYRPRPHA